MREATPVALVLSLDPELIGRIGTALTGIAVLHRADPSIVAVGPALAEARPSLLLVDVQDAGMELANLVSHLRRAAPATALVALGDEGAADAILTCMRAGAQDFLNRQTSELGLRRALRTRFERGVREVAVDRQGPCLIVVGARAVDPSRDVALALAVQRARQVSGPVLFLDLGVDACETEFALDVKPTYSIVDAIENLDRLDTTLLRSAVVQDRVSGLSVMSLPEGARREEMLPGDIGSVLAILRGTYAEVVVHVGADVPANMHPIVTAAPRFALVATQSIASAYRASGLLQAFVSAGIPATQRAVLVVAEHHVGIELAPNTIAGTLGLPNAIALPDARIALRRAVNEGRFAATALQDRTLARRISGLAEVLGAEPRPAPRRLRFLHALSLPRRLEQVQ